MSTRMAKMWAKYGGQIGYNNHLAQKKGFKNHTDYLNYKAKEKGYINYNDYLNQIAVSNGYKDKREQEAKARNISLRELTEQRSQQVAAAKIAKKIQIDIPTAILLVIVRDDLEFCQCCGVSASSNLNIDHCEKLNLFRGIICNQCNTTMGYYSHNTTILRMLYDDPPLNGEGRTTRERIYYYIMYISKWELFLLANKDIIS